MPQRSAVPPALPSPEPARPAPASLPGAGRWDRARLVPTRLQLAVVVVFAVLIALGLLPLTMNRYGELLAETLFVGMALLAGYSVAGAWRQSLLPRWVAQIVGIGVGACAAPLVVQLVSVGGSFSAFIGSEPRVHGYMLVAACAALVGVMVALAALYRERDAQARAEALRFALERETLQRQAADAQLRLMTAQIEPHFLLNTLANVQQLVESGSPQAAPVFRSLIDYLRAAMPKLHAQTATLGDEERLVRAYLELMLMRMPDRLSFRIDVDPTLRGEPFPQMALLTLAENAIRHGIDPGTDGGRVEVGARREGDAMRLWVADTGIGLTEGTGTGTGLRNLRERLAAAYGADARVTLSSLSPHGMRAEIRVTLPREPAAGEEPPQ